MTTGCPTKLHFHNGDISVLPNLKVALLHAQNRTMQRNQIIVAAVIPGSNAPIWRNLLGKPNERKNMTFPPRKMVSYESKIKRESPPFSDPHQQLAYSCCIGTTTSWTARFQRDVHMCAFPGSPGVVVELNLQPLRCLLSIWQESYKNNYWGGLRAPLPIFGMVDFIFGTCMSHSIVISNMQMNLECDL